MSPARRRRVRGVSPATKAREHEHWQSTGGPGIHMRSSLITLQKFGRQRLDSLEVDGLKMAAVRFDELATTLESMRMGGEAPDLVLDDDRVVARNEEAV